MENEKPQNPKAFATSSPSCAKYDGHLQEGMTLLDYFAAKAIGGMLSNLAHTMSCEKHLETLSANAYILAGYMLKEREKHI